MEFNEAKQAMDKLNAQKSALDKQISEVGAEYIRSLAAELFERYPKLESFGWAQYTPYFNDGEPCIFQAGVNYTSEIYINGVSEDYADEIEDDEEYAELTAEGPFPNAVARFDNNNEAQWFDSWNRDARELTIEEIEQIPWRKRAAADVVALLKPLTSHEPGQAYYDRRPDEFFLRLFGDHCKVTITEDGYETEEYEHD